MRNKKKTKARVHPKKKIPSKKSPVQHAKRKPGQSSKRRARVSPVKKENIKSKLGVGATAKHKPKEVMILGAGLVGSLLSIYLAKRGYDVTMYERRPDMRKT